MTLLCKEISVQQHSKVERKNTIIQALLYRGWQDDGEHSDNYCVELQFQNKKTALSYLKRYRIPHTEIADHEGLPFIAS